MRKVGKNTPKDKIAVLSEETALLSAISGRLPAKARFIQYNPEGKDDLDDWRRRFVATMDPTEYKGAIELLGSWSDWVKFKANWPHFNKTILQQWHLEMEMSIRSRAMETLIKLATNEGNTTAAKFIVEGKHALRKYIIDPEAEVKADKINAMIAEDFESDIARMREAEKYV